MLGRSANHDNDVLSRRTKFFRTDADAVVGYVESVHSPHKGMLSEHGWVYVVDDGSAFMQRLFNGEDWSVEDRSRVANSRCWWRLLERSRLHPLSEAEPLGGRSHSPWASCEPLANGVSWV